MIPWLDPCLPAHFPDTQQALQEPNGLLAAGGELTVPWLTEAYRHGIFPWFNEGEPILWWSPAPRTVLFPENLIINRSLQKFLRKDLYHITKDQRFTEVMQACSEPRQGQPGSWISPDMIQAYGELFKAGLAHSYECWDADNVMVGGLYGVSLGQIFYGESMFSHASNASKCCLKALVDSNQYRLIDCQMNTQHLINMGAQDIEREQFEQLLAKYAV
ncbi:MAG: leucyl/phenylalanyl-tRNA--protein transferase [Gammaproteobacteria bacterium]|nr:leucyl/phenylalanyl-tRNA--protein transferase [Gammaproteobacteria bacterium]